MLPPTNEEAGTYHLTFKGWGAMLPPTKDYKIAIMFVSSPLSMQH
jgi:hypothetical protein